MRTLSSEESPGELVVARVTGGAMVANWWPTRELGLQMAPDSKIFDLYLIGD